MKILKKVLIIALLAIIFFTSIISTTSFAFDINIGDKSGLIKEKELPGLLQFKKNGALKLVIKVYYKSLNNKLPAFCLEPDKDGVRYRCWR